MPAAVLPLSNTHGQSAQQTSYFPPLNTSAIIPSQAVARKASSAEPSLTAHDVTGSDVLLPFLDRPEEVRSLLLETPSNAKLSRRLGVTEQANPHSDEGLALSQLLFETSRSQLSDRAWLRTIKSQLLGDALTRQKASQMELWRELSMALGAESVSLEEPPKSASKVLQSSPSSRTKRWSGLTQLVDQSHRDVGDDDDAALDSASDMSSLAPLSPRGSIGGGSHNKGAGPWSPLSTVEAELTALPTATTTSAGRQTSGTPSTEQDETGRPRRPSFALNFASLPSGRHGHPSSASGSHASPTDVSQASQFATYPRRRSRAVSTASTSSLSSPHSALNPLTFTQLGEKNRIRSSTTATPEHSRSRTTSSSSIGSTGDWNVPPAHQDATILKDAELLHIQRRRLSFARSFSDRSTGSTGTSKVAPVNTKPANEVTEDELKDLNTGDTGAGVKSTSGSDSNATAEPTSSATSAPIPVPTVISAPASSTEKRQLSTRLLPPVAPRSPPSPPRLTSFSPLQPLSTVTPSPPLLPSPSLPLSSSAPEARSTPQGQSPYEVAMHLESISHPKPDDLGLGKDGRTRHPSFSGESPPRLSTSTLIDKKDDDSDKSAIEEESKGSTRFSEPSSDPLRLSSTRRRSQSDSSSSSTPSTQRITQDYASKGFGVRHGKVVRLRRLSSPSSSPPATITAIKSDDDDAAVRRRKGGDGNQGGMSGEEVKTTSLSHAEANSQPSEPQQSNTSGTGERIAKTTTTTTTRLPMGPRRKSVTFSDEVRVRPSDDDDDEGDEEEEEEDGKGKESKDSKMKMIPETGGSSSSSTAAGGGSTSSSSSSISGISGKLL